MNVNQLIRVRGAAALLMLLAMLSFGLLSDLRLFRRAVELRPKVIGGDLLSTNERRFDGLRKMLPPHGVVGYISDRQGEAGNDPSFFENYYLTQYSLAPLLVALDSNHPFVVGNFPAGKINFESPALNGLTVVRDFGNGVILFKRESAPALVSARGRE